MMKFSRRQVLYLATAAAALPAATRLANAQGYPTRPVRIISGFPPGGVNDTYARLIGQWLSERLGQQFFIENRPGAGGNIAAETLLEQRPTVTRCFSLPRPTHGMRRFMTTSNSISFGMSLPWRRLRARRRCSSST